MSYIKKQGAFEKLKRAEENFLPAIILAHAGWGKTALVENYFKNRNVLLLSGEGGTLDWMPEINRIRQGIVVIDLYDEQFLD